MKALLVVDIQNDFLPGGALPVPEGDLVIPIINRLLDLPWDLIVATKDWHPQDHTSFAEVYYQEHLQPAEEGQELWPTHCVQGTPGAEFSNQLHADKIDEVVFKGVDREIDSYSGFFDNDHRHATKLHEILRKKNISEIYIAGLATDYCVRFTVLDALKLGYKTTLILDACRGVDIHPGNVACAIKEVQEKGAHVCTSDEILN